MNLLLKSLIIAFAFASPFGLKAEYESKGLFSFSQEDSIVTVVAKLPMAFHSTLEHYESGLKESNFSSLYISAFGEYSPEHLQLFDKEGNTMQRVYLGSAPNTFIQNSRMCFMLKFKGGTLGKVLNSVMLGGKYPHTNHNSFKVDGEEVVVITNNTTPEITAPQSSTFPIKLLSIVSIIAVLLAISLFRFFKR